MKFIPTKIPDIIIIEPKVFNDQRGYFFESFNQKEFEKNIGLVKFVQDNESLSEYGVLRGFHFQKPPFAQSKLVRVIDGHVLDVVVDMRKESSYFGECAAVELSGENKRQLFIPKGFAHAFLVLSQTAVFYYKVDEYYHPETDSGVIFNDSHLNVDWGIKKDKIKLSEKDANLPVFEKAFYF